MVNIAIHDIIGTWTFENLKRVVEMNKSEKKFKLLINSDGGSVIDALAMYDFIRTSDKTWFAEVEGYAHSAATILLLAVPQKNRVCNMNSRALIHNVRTDLVGYYSGDELKRLLEEVDSYQEKIAQVYEERTNLSKEDALVIMEEEKVRDAEWLLANGFVSNIKVYIGNMKKGLMRRIYNLLNIKGYEVMDEEGKLLFTTEKKLFEVGDEAEPDGTYEVKREDKTFIVVITDGVITEITEKEEEKAPNDGENAVTNEEQGEPQKDGEKEPKPEEPQEPTKEQKEIERLTQENEELKKALEDALEAIKELKANIKSNYKPQEREVNAKSPKGYTKEDLRAAYKAGKGIK